MKIKALIKNFITTLYFLSKSVKVLHWFIDFDKTESEREWERKKERVEIRKGVKSKKKKQNLSKKASERHKVNIVFLKIKVFKLKVAQKYTSSNLNWFIKNEFSFFNNKSKKGFPSFFLSDSQPSSLLLYALTHTKYKHAWI